MFGSNSDVKSQDKAQQSLSTTDQKLFSNKETKPVYYVVGGQPIIFMSISLKDGKEDNVVVSSIEDNFIINSYKSDDDKVKVFLNEADAMIYSRWSRTEEIIECCVPNVKKLHQPAIYKVSCSINLEKNKLIEIGLNLLFVRQTDPLKNRAAILKYYDVDSSQLIPIEGSLQFSYVHRDSTIYEINKSPTSMESSLKKSPQLR